MEIPYTLVGRDINGTVLHILKTCNSMKKLNYKTYKIYNMVVIINITSYTCTAWSTQCQFSVLQESWAGSTGRITHVSLGITSEGASGLYTLDLHTYDWQNFAWMDRALSLP